MRVPLASDIVSDERLTLALMGGRVFEHPLLRVFEIAKKTRICVPLFLKHLFGHLFQNICEKCDPRLYRVRLQGQVK